ILDVATEAAGQHGGRVVAVHLKLGPLAGVVKDALVSAYDLAREGTALAGAELVVSEGPVVGYCPACAAEPTPAWPHLLCWACGGPLPEVVNGAELEVVAPEIES